MSISRRSLFSGALFSALAPTAAKLGLLGSVAPAAVMTLDLKDDLNDMIYDISPEETPAGRYIINFYISDFGKLQKDVLVDRA